MGLLPYSTVIFIFSADRLRRVSIVFEASLPPGKIPPPSNAGGRREIGGPS